MPALEMSKEQLMQWAEQYHWPKLIVAGDCIIQPGQDGWNEFMDYRFDVWRVEVVTRIRHWEERHLNKRGVA